MVKLAPQLIYLKIYRHICDFNLKGDFKDSVDPQRNASSPQGLHQQQKKVWKCLPFSLTGISIRLILTFKGNNLDMFALNLELSKSSKILYVEKQCCMPCLLL